MYFFSFVVGPKRENGKYIKMNRSTRTFVFLLDIINFVVTYVYVSS